MSCDCLSKPDYGPRYEQDYGQRCASDCRAVLRIALPGRAAHRAAGQGPCYAPGRGPRSTQDQPQQRHSAAGGTNGHTTPIHNSGHRGPAPLESTAGFMYSTLELRAGVRLGLLESTTHSWTVTDKSGRVIRLHAR